MKRHSALDILQRYTAILQEFRSSTGSIDPIVWGILVGDIVTTALEVRSLDRACQIAQEHKNSLAPLWTNLERVERIFAAFDPKTQEIMPWSQIFESLSTDRLLVCVEQLLGTAAGPQILKLMQLRTQQSPAESVDFAFSSSSFIQKLLLQWLSPHWKPFHYGRILNALENQLHSGADVELLKLWLHALIRASKTNAFEDLVRVFQPRFFWLWGSKVSLQTKRALLYAIAEHPSAECMVFLKKIRSYVHGDLSDQIEKLLRGFKEAHS